MDEEYKLYVIAEMKYKNQFKDIDEDELFPSDWYSSQNYKLKIEVLLEAIKNSKLIKDTKKYSEFQEHVE